MTTVTDICYN